MQALLIDIEGWEIQMERLLKQIEAYKPCNEQEEKDRELLIQWIRSGRDIVTRANETAHLTASAWVVSPDRKHVLMAYHNIYNSWAWLGGHADGEWNLQKVAIREVEEESGLSQVTPLQEAPVSLEILTVDGHWKRGKYVASHLHLDHSGGLHLFPQIPRHQCVRNRMKTVRLHGSQWSRSQKNPQNPGLWNIFILNSVRKH